MPAAARHDRGREFRTHLRLAPQRQREQHIVERLHVALLSLEMNEPVAQDLRQRPDEGARDTPPPRRLRRRINLAPLRGLVGPQHEARKIMRIRRRIAQPRLRHRNTTRRPCDVPGGDEVIILELQHIERRGGPPQRHIRPRHLGRIVRQHARQIHQQMRLDRGRHRLHRGDQRRRRVRQQHPRRIEQRALRRRRHRPHARNLHRRATKRRPRRIIVKARPTVWPHPPPRLADLELRGEPRRQRNPDQLGRHRTQIPHRPNRSRRQQGRRRLPSRQRGRSIPRPLLPIAPAMRVEQFVTERPDHLIAQRLGPFGKVTLPRPRRDIQRTPRKTGV